MITARLYKVKHTHSDPIEDLDCLGNPTVATVEMLDHWRREFPDWNVDEKTGVVTSRGDENFQADGKTFVAVPIFESEAALSYEQRTDLDPAVLHKQYSLKITPNWDAIPDFVKNQPEYMDDLENIQKNTYKRVDVWGFIMEHEVTNLIVSSDGVVSGYDHGCESQYTFTPKD